MKFINYIERISGVSIYGMLSLIIFVTVFMVMLAWVFGSGRKNFAEVSRIPLDN